MLALAVVLTAAVVVLGLVTPFDDPTRDRIDDSLLILGAAGLLNALFLRRSGLVADEPIVRAALAVFALLSAVALVLTDFGAHRGIGQGIKTLGCVVLVAVFAGLFRRPAGERGRPRT